MTEITFRSDMQVDYVQHMGSDEMVARAARVSTGSDLIENDKIKGLIRYLVREKHSSVLEHCTLTVRVEAPIFVAREWMRHRTCVTGDTMIEMTPPGNLVNRRLRSIESIWENWHLGVPVSAPQDIKVTPRYRKRTRDWVARISGKSAGGKRTTITTGPYSSLEELRAAEGGNVTWRRRKLPGSRNLHAVSIDESTESPRPNRVLQVLKQGVKPVYRLTTEDGSTIKATKDHRFLVEGGGYKELQSLEVGDYVQMLGVRGLKREGRLYSRERRQGIGHWATSVARPALLGGKDAGKCYICDGVFGASELEADHIEPVAKSLEKALRLDNMALACVMCHKAKTKQEQSYRGTFSPLERGTRLSRIARIEYAGEEMTYDLMMDAPLHNFVANNFVVHNCSFNEISGRYAELEPVFYVPPTERPLVNEGSGAHPNLVYGDSELYALTDRHHDHIYHHAWSSYTYMRKQGVANEVARNVLPVGIYTQFYATANLNNWFKFLHLRDGNEGSPQYEIVEAANKVAGILEELYPVTYGVWAELNGRG